MNIAQLSQIAITLVALLIFIKCLSLRPIPKALYFLPLSLAALLYAGGYLLQLQAHSLESAYLTLKIQYCGIVVAAVLFYAFVRDFNNRPLSRRVLAGLLAVSLVFLLLACAWPHTTLYFASLAFDALPVPRLQTTGGVLFLPHVLYNLALLLLGGIEVLRHYPRAGHPEKTRLVFLCATVLQIASLATTTLGITWGPVYLGSATLVAALFLLGGYILRFCRLDWLPFVRENVLQNLRSGFVLTDLSGHYMDANEVAKEYFPEIRGLSTGQPLSDVLLGLHIGENIPAQEFRLPRNGQDIYLLVSSNPVQCAGKQLGWCTMLYDITKQHQMMAELEALATHDMLTGLLNRGSFYKQATRDFELLKRTKDHTCLLMLDIDHFKGVNDNYGHQMGDEALRTIGNILSQRLRSTDICGRYGGDEFIMLLPATSCSGAACIAEEICHAAETTNILHHGQSLNLTISIGIAQADPLRHVCLDDWIADADAALYVAKKAGRNHIATFNPPISETINKRKSAAAL